MQVTDASGTTTLNLPRLSGGRRTLAALCAPIAIGSELLGAIEVYSAAPRAFADEESDLLVSFADQAAVALQALRTQEGRQRALLGAVEALASAVEARDGYTGEHCKQLVKRAVQLARGLGFSEREIETIGLAAALHDIGITAGVVVINAFSSSAMTEESVSPVVIGSSQSQLSKSPAPGPMPALTATPPRHVIQEGKFDWGWFKAYSDSSIELEANGEKRWYRNFAELERERKRSTTK